MDVAIILLSALSLVLSTVTIVLLTKNKNDKTLYLNKKDKEEIVNSFSSSIGVISSALKDSADNSTKETKANLESMKERFSESKKSTEESLLLIEKKLEERLESIRLTLERNINSMQSNNEKKLNEIQRTVDEKLTKTLNERFSESFKFLTEEMERVTKTVGEMQNISAEVGTLSKVLSNVKTTGIFGEIQLGAIIDQVLSPTQYVKNVVTNPAGREPVEFAIKLPGGDDGEVLLPVDSKFPYTIYTDMQNAYEKNDFPGYEAKKKQLISTVKGMAKDISDKYIHPPKTTNFGIMFLPVEGLYSEVVKCGLVDELQSKYRVTVAGPTTMAALLNSLQMGFQTLAIQKKSNEVWSILSSVKKEFGRFGDIIEGIQKKLNGASNDLDQLIGVRTRAIDRSLKNVTVLEDTPDLLDLE